jgi:hypothetical protein
MTKAIQLRHWLMLLAAVLAIAFTVAAAGGFTAGTTVALGSYKGPGNPPDPGPVG